MGISAYDAAEAIRRVSEALAQTDYLNTQVNHLNSQIAALQTLSHIDDRALQSRINVIENDLSGIRPELDAITEKLNQKADLEIFKQKGSRRLLPIIEDRIIPIDTKDLDDWYDNFLKELGYDE